ncbi:MAG: hypothetical protein Q9196_002393, partial [Gyalolechia fulgens]
MLAKLFRRIWSAIRKSRLVSSTKTAASDERCPLLDLPVDIIRTLQDFLPLASAASLALTGRTLLETLGNEPLRAINLPANADQKKSFLGSLQRDLPGWQLCHPCSVFHPLDQETKTGTFWRYSLEPECVQISGYVFFVLDYQIRYQHAQLVMNRYRFGTLREGDLKKLSYEAVGPYRGKDLRTVFTASIEDDGLAIYMTAELRLIKSWDKSRIKLWLPEVCPHLDGLRGSQPRPLLATIECQLKH